MGPAGPLGSIQVKVPPRCELVVSEAGLVAGGAIVDGPVGDVTATVVDGIGALAVVVTGDNVVVFGGVVVVGDGVVFWELQPTTNNTQSRNTDRAITIKGFFILLTFLPFGHS